MLEIARDAGLSALVDAGARVETLASGFEFTEGPLWTPDGTLLFQDVKAERTYRLPPGGPARVLREATGAANGQTFAPDGRVVFCEQNGRRVSVMNLDGTGVETLTETFAGERLNSPNDVVCRGSDGLVYFTDPPYGAPPDRPLDFQGVYALDFAQAAGGPRLLIPDFEKPNGLAFSPDEKTLYVCDTAKYHVRAFEVEPSGDLKPGPGRVAAVLDPGEPGGPDGIKVDRAGRLYVAVALGIWVFEPDGALLGIIRLPKRPSNLAWCDADAKGLAVTAGDTVSMVRLGVAGVLPPFTPAGPGR